MRDRRWRARIIATAAEHDTHLADAPGAADITRDALLYRRYGTLGGGAVR